MFNLIQREMKGPVSSNKSVASRILFWLLYLGVISVCVYFCRAKPDAIGNIRDFILGIALPILGMFVLVTNLDELRLVLLDRLQHLTKIGKDGVEFDKSLKEASKASGTLSSPIDENTWRNEKNKLIQHANTVIMNDPKLRPSLTGLDLSKYTQLAMVDPRMAIRSYRIGLEILFRNVLEVGEPGHYRKGESIKTVLERLYSANGITDATYELASNLFDVISAADGGVECDKRDADEVNEQAEKLLKLYINWLCKPKEQRQPF